MTKVLVARSAGGKIAGVAETQAEMDEIVEEHRKLGRGAITVGEEDAADVAKEVSIEGGAAGGSVEGPGAQGDDTEKGAGA